MKEKTQTTTGLRDYNIITNRYLELHDAKVKTDQEIQKVEAAINYWKTHDFNPVTSSFYDPEKEQDFVEERVVKQKMHGRNKDDPVGEDVSSPLVTSLGRTHSA